jgi:hypothetical protein
MKNANTDLFLSSIKSRAIRSCLSFFKTVVLNFGQILIACGRKGDSPKIIFFFIYYVVCGCVVFYIGELMKAKEKKEKILKNVL